MRRIKKLGREHKVLLALAVTLPLAALADDPTINRMLASQCSQCHGTNGYAVSGIDSLAGESAREIREEMDEMQFEDTPDEIMDHQALGYSDDQIRRIAEYFSSLPENRPAGTPAIRLVEGDSGGDGGGSQDQDRDDEDRDEDRDDEDRDEYGDSAHDDEQGAEDEDEDEEDEEDEDEDEEDEEDEDEHQEDDEDEDHGEDKREH